MKKTEQFAAGSETVNTTERGGKIRQHINGRAVGGAAVAAALVAANVGIIGAVIHAKNSDTSKPATSDIQEIQYNVPYYAQCMQDYYTKLNGEPCNFDFTGYGQNLDYEWTFTDYKVNLRAAAGDAFTVHFFYDVTPLKGQTYSGTDFATQPLLFYLDNETGITSFTAEGSDFYLNGPEAQGERPSFLSVSQDGENGGEVWHFCSTVIDPTGFGFCQKDFAADAVNLQNLSSDDSAYWADNKYVTKLDFIQEPVWLDIDRTNAPEFAELGYTQAAVTPMTVMLSVGEHDPEYYEMLTNYTAEAGRHSEMHYEQEEILCTAQMLSGTVNVAWASAPLYLGYFDVSEPDRTVHPLNEYLMMKTPLDLKSCKSLTLRDAVIPINPDLPDEPAVTPVSDDQPQITNYVKLMQQAFDCDLDFTGCGEDCWQTWTVGDAEIRLKALCGDRYNLFYFYEIEGYDTDSLRLAVCPARLDQFFPNKICESWRCLSEKTSDDGKKTVLVFCEMNGIIDMQNAVPLSYQNYGLNAVPYRLTDGEYIEAGDPQYVLTDFLDSENAFTPVSLTCREDFLINEKSYKYAFVTPFGIRLMSDSEENMIANNIGALAVRSERVSLMAGFSTDDSMAARFMQLPVQYGSEISYGSVESDYQADIIVAKFEKPVDLTNAKLFEINGYVFSVNQESDTDDGIFELGNAEIRIENYSADECFSSGNVKITLIPHPDNIPEDATYTLTIDAMADGEILYRLEASLLNDGSAEIPFAFTLPEDFTGDTITVLYKADNYDYGGQYIIKKSNPD